MMDKEELLNNKDFYKYFKSGEDLTSFFKELHKKAVEHMLDAKLDSLPIWTMKNMKKR